MPGVLKIERECVLFYENQIQKKSERVPVISNGRYMLQHAFHNRGVRSDA